MAGVMLKCKASDQPGRQFPNGIRIRIDKDALDPFDDNYPKSTLIYDGATVPCGGYDEDRPRYRAEGVEVYSLKMVVGRNKASGIDDPIDIVHLVVESGIVEAEGLEVLG
jgi:hypothetical protein